MLKVFSFYFKKRKRIFVSHGKHPEVYKTITRFLEVLQLQPVIDENEPNLGNGIDMKVQRMMNSCGSGMIIATPDDPITTGQNTIFQPRGNVLQEIGKAQELYGKRIVYLKEKNACFPSNINPKVYYSFEILDERRVLLAEVYLGIVRELKAFGILRLER